MAKAKVSYVCSECGWDTPKWAGQCRGCQAWGSLEEFAAGPPPSTTSASPTALTVSLAPSAKALPISEIQTETARARTTGVGELDRVLGSGIVPGAVVLLAGEPGVGKSTLLLDVAARAAQAASDNGAGPVLYITGEESASQVRLRAERIGALHPHLHLAAETDLAKVLGHVEKTAPSMLIADSVQTIASTAVSGGPGGSAQVRAVASGLIALAKRDNLPVLLVGHVTKDGAIAGPRVLEHLVDVVCQFEGDRHTSLRLLRAVKNRYGPTDEVGCFELNDSGIIGLEDPAGLFLSESGADVPGVCVTVTLEGRRPIPTEIQALVAPPSHGGAPRRTTSGLDNSRTAMTLAVLSSRLGLDLGGRDVYLSTIGGAKTAEPAVDLAVALAVISAAHNRSCKARLIAVGEVALTGEVRASVGLSRRLGEAARLGFKYALVPASGAGDLTAPPGMELIPVANLAQAATMGLVPAPQK